MTHPSAEKRSGAFTLRQLISHDLRMARLYLRERDWRRVRMFLGSALSRPYHHWRKPAREWRKRCG